MELEFIITRKVLISANGNYHYHDKGNRVKKLRQLAYEVGLMENKKFNLFEIDVKILPPTRRRLDPPNLYPTVKPILDGLTDSDLWEDDDWKHLRKLSFEYGGLSGIKDCYKIILNIKEIKENE